MKILGYIFVFIIAVFAMLPTKNLFFLAQKELNSQHIIINANEIKEYPFDFELDDIELFYKDIKVSHIENVKFLTFIIFNKIDIKNIKINFQELFINNLSIDISVFNPMNLYIKGTGSFGDIDGVVDLKNRTIKVYIMNLKNNNIKFFLKKDKKGYFYADKF